jgi:hypothetical protein
MVLFWSKGVARKRATAPEVTFYLRALHAGLYIAGAPIVHSLA